MLSKKALLLVCMVLLTLTTPFWGVTGVTAGQIIPGDIIVTDPKQNAVILVDPVTGDTTTISAGGLFFNDLIRGIVIHPNGKLYVTVPGGIIRVDPVSGIQTTFSSGGNFSQPIGIAIDTNGFLFIVDNNGGVIRVDPSTGDQTLISSGGIFQSLNSIAVDASGDLLVTDTAADSIFRVDPVTGGQTTVSTGGSLANPSGIAIDANGDLLISDPAGLGGAGAVIRVDPVSGAQTTVSSGGIFQSIVGIVIDSNGDLIVSDQTARAVFRIDPVAGDQTTITSVGFLEPFGIAVAEAPIPDGPVCSSTITTIDGLKAEVDALSTSISTKATLTSLLKNAQSALDSGTNEKARSRMRSFIQKVVRHSNIEATNPGSIPLDEANDLICGAANVLIGIPLP